MLIMLATMAQAAIIATSPPPALPMVFGLQLGSPVTLPECKLAVIGGQQTNIYDTEQDQTCQQKPGVMSPSPTYGAIYFIPKQMPTVAGFNLVTTRIVEGNLEAVRFMSPSDASKDRIIAELTTKFGKPDTVYPETTTLNGIAVPSTSALWRRAGYSVTYHSVGARVDFGDIRIETAKGVALRESEDRASQSQRTPL